MFKPTTEVGFVHLAVILALGGWSGQAVARNFGLSPPGDYYTVFPHDPVMLTLTSSWDVTWTNARSNRRSDSNLSATNHTDDSEPRTTIHGNENR